MRARGLIFALLLPLPAMAAPENCYVRETHGGTVVMAYIGDRKCVEFDAPREISGVWINMFEGQAFYEGAASLADTDRRSIPVWFSRDEQTIKPEGFKSQLGHAYRLTLIGKMAKDMNRKPLEGYGHMGIAPGLVLADRIIAFEDLGSLSRR